MSSNGAPTNKRSSRNVSDGFARRQVGPLNTPSPMPYASTNIQYYPVPQPWYPPIMDSSQVEPISYVMPYGAYQPPSYPNMPSFHNGPALHYADAQNSGPPSTYVPNTPPTKRLRTDLKTGTVVRSEIQRRDLAKRNANKFSPGRKTFSDFRISKIEIGAWESEEIREEPESRDSRIRFCFRNANDKDVDSTLSATEAALVTPDRISISVARGTRRIVVPAHHIKSVEFRRHAGEVRIETDGWAAFEVGTDTVLEEGSPMNKAGQACATSTSWALTEEDFTGGELASSKVIKIKLDQQRPLTEPKWTRGSLADHVDVNSRFLKILKIMDTEAAPSLDEFLDQWAGDDAERAYFVEYTMTSTRLTQLLMSLMSTSNILTPALQLMLQSLLTLVQKSDTSEKDVTTALKAAVFLIPSSMLTKSLDTNYEAYLVAESLQPHNVQAAMGGSKRQRGESEVPSEQLARTTLDEKRRRLSESDPQTPTRQAQIREQLLSKEAIEPKHTNPVITKRMQTVVSPTHSTSEDGARMSREELLKSLESREDFDSASEEDDHDHDIIAD